MDDSGTHEEAPVVVWGGILGKEDQVRKLEVDWNNLLLNPLPGKPSLTRFHLVDCLWRDGEFSNYSFAEAEHLQHLFRQIILNSGVTPIGYATDKRAWDRIVTGEIRDFMWDAEVASFVLCIKAAVQIMNMGWGKLSIIADKGASRSDLEYMHMKALERYGIVDYEMPLATLPVTGTPGLQAADMVAGYLYRFAPDWLNDPSSTPNPHLMDMTNNSENILLGAVSEDEISSITSEMRKKLFALRKQPLCS